MVPVVAGILFTDPVGVGPAKALLHLAEWNISTEPRIIFSESTSVNFWGGGKSMKQNEALRSGGEADGLLLAACCWRPAAGRESLPGLRLAFPPLLFYEPHSVCCVS